MNLVLLSRKKSNKCFLGVFEQALSFTELAELRRSCRRAPILRIETKHYSQCLIAQVLHMLYSQGNRRHLLQVPHIQCLAGMVAK